MNLYESVGLTFFLLNGHYFYSASENIMPLSANNRYNNIDILFKLCKYNSIEFIRLESVFANRIGNVIKFSDTQSNYSLTIYISHEVP